MTGNNPPPDDKPTAAYDVGYRKPPAHTQFKPGMSGNKQGRPKGQPTFGEILAKEGARHVTIKGPNGQGVITKSEAVIRRLFQSAMEGDIAAARLVLYALAQHATSTTAELSNDEAEAAVLGGVPDDEMLCRMLARFSHLQPIQKETYGE
jgi:hypothetical protein